jgi:hypothetical protein
MSSVAYNFSVLDQTFSFKEVLHDLAGTESAEIYAMIRLSDRVTVLSSIPDDRCTEELKWKCLKLEGEYDFSAYGILAEISQAFAKARIPVMVFSDYRTDYFAVQKEHLSKAIESLKSHGSMVTSVHVKETHF